MINLKKHIAVMAATSMLALMLAGCEAEPESVVNAASITSTEGLTNAAGLMTRSMDEITSTLTINGKAAELTDNMAVISSAGSYVISGELTGSTLYIDSSDEEPVELILSGVTLTNENDSAIYVNDAGDIIITLAEGTVNTVSSGIYTTEEASEEASGGAIYSKKDLIIRGTGVLNVNGYINNGIQTKDDLTIESGVINIYAANNGIKGKDSVTIEDGTITIKSIGDAIQSDNDTDETKGTVTINGGKLVIETNGDGIQAETTLNITGGEFDIVIGGGYENASGNSGMEDFRGSMGFGNNGDMQQNGNTQDGFIRGNKGQGNQMPGNQMPGMNGNNGQTEMPSMPEGTDMTGMPDMPEGTDMTGMPGMPEGTDMTEMPENVDAVNMPTGKGNFGGMFNGGMTGNTGWGQTTTDSEESDYGKAIKAGTAVVISGGTFNINCADDAIHSNGDLTINEGTYIIFAGDDGLHADGNLVINGGLIDISASYEGVEAMNITVNDGTISVTSSDDGFNAADGTTSGSMFGGFFGGASSGTLPELVINGGKIVVNADGDGLDSNGNITVNGGDIIVNGPTNSGNGSLDCGTESGGKAAVNGGSIIALGASGMAETFGATSTQCSFICNFNASIGAGSEVTVKDKSGNVIYTYTAVKSFNSIVFSSEKLVLGETYTVTAGSQTTAVTLSSVSTGSSNGFGNMNGGFNRNNRK